MRPEVSVVIPVMDEAENVDNDRVFVSRPPSPAPAIFDDLVIWVSPNILYGRMIAAGAL